MASIGELPQGGMDQFVDSVLRGRRKFRPPRHPFANGFVAEEQTSVAWDFAREGADRMRRSRLHPLLQRHSKSVRRRMI